MKAAGQLLLVASIGLLVAVYLISEPIFRLIDRFTRGTKPEQKRRRELAGSPEAIWISASKPVAQVYLAPAYVRRT